MPETTAAQQGIHHFNPPDSYTDRPDPPNGPPRCRQKNKTKPKHDHLSIYNTGDTPVRACISTNLGPGDGIYRGEGGRGREREGQDSQPRLETGSKGFSAATHSTEYPTCPGTTPTRRSGKATEPPSSTEWPRSTSRSAWSKCWSNRIA